MRMHQTGLDERPLRRRTSRMLRRTVVRHVRPRQHKEPAQHRIEIERVRPAARLNQGTGHRPTNDRAQIRAHYRRREYPQLGRRRPGGEELVRRQHDAALHDARQQNDGDQRLERVLGRPRAEQLQNAGHHECGEHHLAHVAEAIEQNAQRQNDDSGAGKAAGQQDTLLQRRPVVSWSILGAWCKKWA